MKRLTFVYLTAANTLVLLLALEAGGQLLYRALLGHWVFEPYPARAAIIRPYEPHPYLVARLRPGTTSHQGPVTITATSRSTRWTGAPPMDGSDRFVVATVGGSTTFGQGVTDEDSWPALLQERLGSDFAVVNYGLPGFSTAEGIIQMGLVVPESRPDVVVFYEGWNDIHNYHDPDFTPDYYAHGMQQLGNLGIDPSAVDTRGFVHRAGDYSAIFRLVSRLSMRLRPESTEGEPTLHTEPDPRVDRAYLRNLRTLRAMSEHLGAHALFVPQILNDRRFLSDEGGHEWTPRIRSTHLPRLLRRFNGFMSEACRPDDPTCTVVDEVTEEDWTGRDFVDSGHFSRQGGQKFAALVAEHVLAAASR